LAKLKVITPSDQTKIITIPEDGVLIGRSWEKLEEVLSDTGKYGLPGIKNPGFIVSRDPENSLSNRHCWIGYDKKSQKLILKDLGSENGTYIGNRHARVTTRALQDKDTIKCCRKGILKLVVETEAAVGFVASQARPKRKSLIWIFTPILIIAIGFLLYKFMPATKPRTLSMPNLLGLTLDSAKTFISKNKLVLTKIDSAYSDDFKKGSVINFLPTAGTKLFGSESINLIYANGRKTCPICHAIRKTGAIFCTKCGYKFD
jgi:pSer/pThr/pTyr-binding forkhead associated (FHA) protein